MAHGFPGGGIAVYLRSVDMGAAILFASEVPFLAEDPHHREDGVVGGPIGAGEGFGDFGDGGGAFVPDDFHDAMFGVGEGAGFFSGHSGRFAGDD